MLRYSIVFLVATIATAIYAANTSSLLAEFLLFGSAILLSISLLGHKRTA
jgi:hypothetical protein